MSGKAHASQGKSAPWIFVKILAGMSGKRSSDFSISREHKNFLVRIGRITKYDRHPADNVRKKHTLPAMYQENYPKNSQGESIGGESMKRRFLIKLGMLLIIFSGAINIAQAYTVEVATVLGGLDLETGTVYRDHTVAAIVFTDLEEVSEVIQPDLLTLAEFDPSVDFFFTFTPDARTLMVNLLLGSEMAGWDTVGNSLLLSDGLETADAFHVALNEDESFLIQTAEDLSYLLSFSETDTWEKVLVKVEQISPNISGLNVPEPSTMILLGSGILVLVGIIRRRKKVVGMKEIAVWLICIIPFGLVENVQASLQTTDAKAKIATIEIPFIANLGQLSEPIAFYANTFGGTVFVTDEGTLVYALPKEGGEDSMRDLVLREELVGGIVQRIAGTGESVTQVNYFKGNDPSQWCSNIPTYQSVNFGEVYEGIELELKAHGNNVEKLFVIQPGAAPEKIRLRIQGANKLHVNNVGELEVETRAGVVKFTKPLAYQEELGVRHYIGATYFTDKNEYGFHLEDYDKNQPLIIDPLLASTFIDNRNPFSISSDNNGNVYVSGNTYVNGGYDVFISKLDRNLESVISSTFLGGTGEEAYYSPNYLSIAINNSGEVYVAGYTTSSDFPTTENAFDTDYKGLQDVFIAKFDSDLQNLLASTYLGGGNGDYAHSISLDREGNVFVVGKSSWLSGASGQRFPTTIGAYDTSYKPYTAFISKLDSSLQNLLASTFVHGNGGSNEADSVTIDDFGNVYVAGVSGADYITSSCRRGDGYALLTKFDNNLQRLLACRFIKTNRSVISLDRDNNVYVAGTATRDFSATSGSYDTTHNGSNDGYILKLDNNFQSILASTFLGGSSNDGIYSIAVNDDGNIYVSGYTQSYNFPTTSGAFDTTYNGGDRDAFLSVFDNDLQNLLSSTFLGGRGKDSGFSISLSNDNKDIFVSGPASSGFPVTANAYDQTYRYGGFIAKFDLSDVLGFHCDNITEISNVECEALKVFYNSTGGDGWIDKSGWLQTKEPCSWYGVGCDAGHVISLGLSNNNLKESLPSEIGNLSQLKYLSLNRNQLNTLPSEIGELTQLEQLDLGTNQLSELPSGLWNLSQLQDLVLDRNQLQNVPSEIENLTQLRTLDLSDNQLSDIPLETGNLSQLTLLNLSSNQLSEIPSEVGELTLLSFFDISNNLLSGPVPSFLTQLSHLTLFHFDETSLCEPQDDDFQNWLASIPLVESTQSLCSFEIKTFILTNRQQLAALYTDGVAGNVINKVNALTAHPNVQGLLIELTEDSAVAAAYAARGTDFENQGKSNAVAEAIRQHVLQLWEEHPTVEYLVIVGDDRVIPFYRSIDGTSWYQAVFGFTPDAWTLTDDFYADYALSPCASCANPEHFVPDLGVGRLIERPEQIVSQIDTFLAQHQVQLRTGAVTGYDFMQDVANKQCLTMQADGVETDCALIGNSWTQSAFENTVLNKTHDVIAIGNHANPNGFSTPGGGFVHASKFADAAADFSRKLIYSMGCHSGQNIASDIDLPEALTGKNADYIGNTGYGWGGNGIVWAEDLMLKLTRQIVMNTSSTPGQALKRAKRQYYLEAASFSVLDEKTVLESTLYGLPMYEMISLSATAPQPDTPVSLDAAPLPGSAGLYREHRVYSWPMPAPVVSDTGIFYAINGAVTSEADKPVLPKLTDDLSHLSDPVHRVVFLGGAYTLVDAKAPVQQANPIQSSSQPSSATFDAPGWYPSNLAAHTRLNAKDDLYQGLVVTAGQYHPELEQQRIFTEMEFEIYATGNSDDFTPPTIAAIHSLREIETVNLTVEVDDLSGIEAVFAVYTDGKGRWEHIRLAEEQDRWLGTFPLETNTEYFIQAVDRSGNVTLDDNQGRYFTGKDAELADSLALLTLRKFGSGRGTVLAGNQICDNSCEELELVVPLHAAVYLKAISEDGSYFVRYEQEDGTLIDDIVRVRSGQTVLAIFEKK